jgi:FlaA1/EpsC-like NDP-sugar epimerase
VLIRNRHLLFLDAAVMTLGVVTAYFVRFESTEGFAVLRAQWVYPLLSIPLRLVILWAGGIYRILWRHASVREFLQLAAVGAIAGGANLLLGAQLLPASGLIQDRVPLSVLLLGAMVTIGGPAAIRVVDRVVFLAGRRNGAPSHKADRRRRRVLIAGAGEAGRLVADQLLRSGGAVVPVGFLDDDPTKRGRLLAGLPVLGGLEDLEAIATASTAAELVIAMPSAPGSTIRDLAAAARRIPLEVQTVPGVFELATGRVTVTALRKLRIEDLLRREPIETDLDAVRTLVHGKRVLVTGAGGSIGTELCRQLAACEPESIGLLGHGENSIFEVHGELRERFPHVSFTPMIADIRDRPRLAVLFHSFGPQLVFHAAAHKHVPLMEANPVEAVTNNIAGTWNVAELSAAHGAERFVMISTDKAVRPTNVMGASKRVAEQLVQELSAGKHDTMFAAVRFGNVLGSRGSVVPTFRRQIAAGGPLTLTHPEVRRFFMTIPEAVQLVLQAAVMSAGGEVFALDMGEAIRIVDLAEDLIRLSGLEVGRDIAVEFIGLRPGEKLYEEVFFAGDLVEPTAHPKIRLTRQGPVPVGLLSVVRLMEERANANASGEELRNMLRRLVPDFHPEGLPVDKWTETGPDPLPGAAESGGTPRRAT